MSFEYYTNKWIVTKKNLEDLTLRDDLWKNKAKPITDRIQANLLFGDWYARYCMLYQDLDNCIDQMVQPQKRKTVKKIVDAAAMRLLEFNDVLLDIDLSEYHYIDGTLVELKLVPYDIEILPPALFHHRLVDIEDMWTKIQRGEKIFVRPPPEEPEQEPEQDDANKEKTETKEDGTANAEGKGVEEQSEKDKEEPNKEPDKEAEEAARAEEEKKKKRRPKSKAVREEGQKTPEELAEIKRREYITSCVRLIQTAERGRIERLYYLVKWCDAAKSAKAKMMVMNEQQMQNSQEQKAQSKPAEAEEQLRSQNQIEISAATTVQSVWRSFTARQLIKFKEIQRRFLIGMYEPVWRSLEYKEVFRLNLEKRREYRDQRIREYIEAIDNEKARILRVVAPGLMEDIGDEIREWFKEWYTEVKQFDDIPPEEKGGTILVVRGETMTPQEFLDEIEKKRKEKAKAGGAKAQKAKEKKERAKAKKLEADKKKKELQLKKKLAAAKLAKKKKRKPGQWEYDDFDEESPSKPVYLEGALEHTDIWDKRPDVENPLEKHYMDIITDQLLLDNQYECRQIVDNMMRVELEILNDALDEDRVKYGGKRKKKKKGQNKKKKKKGKKGKKDMTGNRAVEDLFQELVDNEIIRTYPKVTLDEFHGDFSYNNWEYRKMDYDPPAAFLDVRQAVVMNCIIPLGVEQMKRPKSVLIFGPEQSGKHILANAIFNETKCVLFDLSPERLDGKYEGSKGMKMLVHLIDKMSKLLAPSIIYFPNAERQFYKKVPKEEKELNPKRMGNKLKKITKGIKPPDRVLVLGVTNCPWAAQSKLKKMYEKHIMVPRTEYNTAYMFWRELLMRYPGVDRNFNFTALTRVTKNYTYTQMREALEQVLTPRRIIQLHFKPLSPEEIYEYYIQTGIQPITDKKWKKYQKWYGTTKVGRQQAKFNKWANALRAKESKKK